MTWSKGEGRGLGQVSKIPMDSPYLLSLDMRAKIGEKWDPCHNYFCFLVNEWLG